MPTTITITIVTMLLLGGVAWRHVVRRSFDGRKAHLGLRLLGRAWGAARECWCAAPGWAAGGDFLTRVGGLLFLLDEDFRGE